ncbi:hypothetical protein C2845_PM06G24060 [Panicum miliaceum]|uniref:RRM domain-containing protein n=1 Tax=Panicum miliaceum TaxID=4540 RepID=A0A3L6R8S5_PANMI|nr:hypothetical protein C2845_PM06G24060 [Panicum miliaceum]
MELALPIFVCISILSNFGCIVVIDLKIPPRPPGFAFVEFEDPRDVEDAIYGRDGYNSHRLWKGLE